jgi:2-keto-4-pentenoate hydratase/2-oxohepta-3-ene-1,7-dioic acid hydratase in catechol pathway
MRGHIVGAHNDLHSDQGARKQEHPGRSRDPIIKVHDIAWLEFEKPDLARAEAFSRAFGFNTVVRTADELYLRGTDPGSPCVLIQQGPRSRFVAAAYTAQDHSDVLRLAEATGTRMHTLPESLGGVAVDLVDPSGLTVRVVAQLANYASHAEDAGRNPATDPLAFFRKASGSITGPLDDIIKPEHVRLLDYEVEIGLVIGRDVPVGTAITEANLSDYISGLVVANDVSARDVQLTKTQFYESKSYPTFTPVGPALVLLNGDELKRFGDLRLRLQVNGEIRQDMLVDGDIIYRPVQALQALSRFQRLDAGDLVLTGTPVGTAISAPPKPFQIIGSLLPDQLKWKTFFSTQAKNPKYLRHGDVVEAAVATDDGAIDLGAQRNVVKYTGATATDDENASTRV